MTEFSQPHWSDPVVRAVAETVYLDAGMHVSAPPFISLGQAVEFWPGMEARRFVAMMRAYEKATTENAVGTDGPRSGPVVNKKDNP